MRTFNLQNKKILVTGASSGIGRQIAIDCLRDNCQELIGVARRLDQLEETGALSEIRQNFRPVTCDLTAPSQVDALVGTLPSLDGIVLNAGVADFLPTRFLTTEKLQKIFSVNLECNIRLLAELQKKKKLAASSSIVLISSLSSKLGVTGTAAYAASKAALSAYGRVLASELASQKIRVNSVLPGLVSTALIEDSTALSQESLKKNTAAYPLGLGTPVDVSNLVGFLLSDLSRWITGDEIVIDGGFLLA
jgi:NAD(P)-dependent dehydrogenase (short-subunit alcohol dehydrogenase family)